MEPESSPASADPHYHGFWPVFLIGMSLVLILVWEIQVGVFTRRNAGQLREQQLRLVDQANHVRSELEKIVRGLVDLSKTDDAAQRIVTKFGIKVNNPSVPTETPVPAP
ncbi:MAG: hypothetical protein H0X34_11585 [Chthoniobacterales bacterium]|nr:hypothetical protein [Chthoniobacterales bacterium]